MTRFKLEFHYPLCSVQRGPSFNLSAVVTVGLLLFHPMMCGMRIRDASFSFRTSSRSLWAGQLFLVQVLLPLSLPHQLVHFQGYHSGLGSIAKL